MPIFVRCLECRRKWEFDDQETGIESCPDCNGDLRPSGSSRVAPKDKKKEDDEDKKEGDEGKKEGDEGKKKDDEGKKDKEGKGDEGKKDEEGKGDGEAAKPSK
jgi:hypothetical protein